MRIQALASSVLALVLAGGGCVGGGGGGSDVVVADAELVVSNNSDFAIFELYLTEVDNPTWGRNLLSGDVLLPGERLSLGVSCDFYDALLVDEDGVECEIHDLDLCLNQAHWVIRNNTCTVFGAAKARREAEAAAKAAQ